MEYNVKRILEKAILHTGYTNLVNVWDDSCFNMFVMVGHIISDDETCHLRVGRVVQVRFGLGDFGSDIVLLRTYNGDVVQHENQLYGKIIYFICEDLVSIFPEKDIPNTVYALENGAFPEKGFLIGESKSINNNSIIESHRSHK